MLIDLLYNKLHGKQFIRPQDCKLRQYYHAFFGAKLKLNFSFMQLNMLILHLVKFAKVQLCNKFAAYVSFSKRLVIRNFQNQRLYFIYSRRFLENKVNILESIYFMKEQTKVPPHKIMPRSRTLPLFDKFYVNFQTIITLQNKLNTIMETFNFWVVKHDSGKSG